MVTRPLGEVFRRALAAGFFFAVGDLAVVVLFLAAGLAEAEAFLAFDFGADAFLGFDFGEAAALRAADFTPVDVLPPLDLAAVAFLAVVFLTVEVLFFAVDLAPLVRLVDEPLAVVDFLDEDFAVPEAFFAAEAFFAGAAFFAPEVFLAADAFFDPEAFFEPEDFADADFFDAGLDFDAEVFEAAFDFDVELFAVVFFLDEVFFAAAIFVLPRSKKFYRSSLSKSIQACAQFRFHFE